MKRKILSIFSLLIGFLGFSQTEVYFKYDEAGNQRYRGTNTNEKKAPDLIKQLEEAKKEEPKTILATNSAIDEKTFWKQIRLYPIPVNDFSYHRLDG